MYRENGGDLVLILPCAGSSSRFPGLRPKWQLTQPNGDLMVCDAIKHLNLENVSKIVLIALQEHLGENTNGIFNSFNKRYPHKKLEIFELKEKTNSQPETIAKYLASTTEDFSFFIKDCDGQFDAIPRIKNEVIICDIEKIVGSNTASKSYCRLNENGTIVSIVEKSVISQTFCVGGYSFKSSKQFLQAYKHLEKHDDLYVSHIVDYLTFIGENFNGTLCNHYEDWGTLDEWLKYKSQFCTLFLDIDGVLVENSSEFFSPKWGTTPPLKRNIEHIMSLRKTGKLQIILTTARSKEYSSVTEKQLKEAGLEYDNIVYGMLHAKRIIVNDFSKSNPFPTCGSVNLQRNVEELETLLRIP